MVIGMIVASFGLAAAGIALILIADGFLCAGRYNKDLVARMIGERQTERAADRALPPGAPDTRI